jgi:mRNA-degrading endonuclease toxin of MazEF toxin-antitoxin module
MRRGDVITVAAAGDCGKPRPAVIVQTDASQQPTDAHRHRALENDNKIRPING